MIYCIKDWSKTFENADTRKRQRLGWYLAPTGCDSRGFRQLARMGTQGLIALGVFHSLCQLMGTLSKEVRASGRFINSDGTGMTVADFQEMTRMPLADIQQALADLQQIGWLSVEGEEVEGLDLTPGAIYLPPSCHPSATHLPPICHLPPGFVKGEGEGQGEGQGEGEASGRPLAEPVGALSLSGSKAMNRTTADEFKAKVNALSPMWSKVRHWSAAELHSLHDCISALSDLTEDDWKLLGKFYQAHLDQGSAYWRPNSRKQFLDAFPDVFGHAMRWAEKGGHQVKDKPSTKTLKGL